jgi:hypothetical protein
MTDEMLLQEIREAITQVNEMLSRGTFSVAREGYPTTEELTAIRSQLVLQRYVDIALFG